MPLYRSPAYTPILRQEGIIVASIAAGTFWFDEIGTRTASGTGTATARRQFVFAAADWPGFTVGNLQVSLATTATQTGVTFTFGLYPIANTGTTTIIPTFGMVIAGSTVAFVAPAAASETSGTSGDFALPAANLYMIGCVTDATTAAASETSFTALLRAR